MPKTRRDENDDSDDAIQSVLVSGYKRFRRETMMMCHRNKEALAPQLLAIFCGSHF